ncbi:MAG: hypothetical protein R6X02_22160 [Enhygromyxa sp.]
MQRRARRWSLAWLCSAALGCSKSEPEAPPPVEHELQIIPLEEDEASPYPAFDPAKVTPLEVLYFSEPVGKGYARRPVEIGKTLHSGKYLGLANGQAEFFGPKHIIVDHLRRRPRNPFMGEIKKSVLLDVETGEVVTEFARYGRPIQWSRGLAIVYPDGDERPHLLDVENSELVLAVPEGEHDYVLGENYWIRFSWADRGAWIVARDAEEVVHLYAWEDRSAAPELPNNPFPFFPDEWDSGGDADEVWSRDAGECERAILIPPRRWECLEERLAESLPLSQGWRLDRRGVVFNHGDGRGFDLGSLCPAEHPVRVRVLDRARMQVQIGCEGDPNVWMVWTAPDRVQRLDPELAVKVNKAEIIPVFFGALEKFELSEPLPDNIHSEIDFENLALELVGTDYSCPSIHYHAGHRYFSGVECRRTRATASWFELIDETRKARSRFQAESLAVSRTGLAIGVVRQSGRDRVVRLGIQ